ncbi:hypothetical protein [Paenibacillus sp. GCM10012303]|uniref:hypothetical protein n=1 Tax=Paenibacillus sp. GCM10012303 TaxID=3317340 RepID=UPI0036D31245
MRLMEDPDVRKMIREYAEPIKTALQPNGAAKTAFLSGWTGGVVPKMPYLVWRIPY